MKSVFEKLLRFQEVCFALSERSASLSRVQVKTMEAEILREAVELAREKKWIARSPLLDKDGQ